MISISPNFLIFYFSYQLQILSAQQHELENYSFILKFEILQKRKKLYFEKLLKKKLFGLNLFQIILQDGSYLAELLLGKGYKVHGIIRRSSTFNTGRIKHLYSNKFSHSGGEMKLHYGDLTDSSSLIRIISEIRPDEIYNLAAQSHVKVKKGYNFSSLMEISSWSFQKHMQLARGAKLLEN